MAELVKEGYLEVKTGSVFGSVSLEQFEEDISLRRAEGEGALTITVCATEIGGNVSVYDVHAQWTATSWGGGGVTFLQGKELTY